MNLLRKFVSLRIIFWNVICVNEIIFLGYLCLVFCLVDFNFFYKGVDFFFLFGFGFFGIFGGFVEGFYCVYYICYVCFDFFVVCGG